LVKRSNAMEQRLQERKRMYKYQGAFLSGDKRREDFLFRQTESRCCLIDSFREMFNPPISVHEKVADDDEAHKNKRIVKKNKCKSSGVARQRHPTTKTTDNYFSNLLVHTEYMIETPPDLMDNWLVFLRPEGPRVLIVSIEGFATMRKKNGRVVGEFPCGLPSGTTILDCILVGFGYNELEWLSDDCGRKKIYIQDILCWNECVITDSSAECRQFFLQSRFQESIHEIECITEANRFPFALVEAKACCPTVVGDMYFTHFPFEKDGLVFIHKEAHYVPGINPLYLSWKDSSLSSWSVHTTDCSGQTFPENFQVCLELSPARDLMTSDGSRIYTLSVEEMTQLMNIAPGRRNRSFVRVTLDDVGIVPDGTLRIGSITIDGFASPSRIVAESLSRLVFLYSMRSSAPFFSLDELVLSIRSRQSVGRSVTHVVVENALVKQVSEPDVVL